MNFFVETLIKIINYWRPVPLLMYHYWPFTYVYCENCMSGFYAFFLSLSKSDNILFWLMSNGNFLFSSSSIVISGTYEITHWCMKLDQMVAVELHVNASYYAQHPALNEISLWKKPISNWWWVIFVFIEQSKQGGRWLRI